MKRLHDQYAFIIDRFQVIIFYPSDWEDDCSSLLSSFSSLFKQFSSSDCCVYGCSTDCIGSHLDWIKTKFGSSLPFPLLSDMAGTLAGRFGLFDEEERINMRAVVITDNEGMALEVINTSMEDKQVAEYSLSLVKQMLEHRRLLEKNGHLQKTQVAQEQTQSGRDTLLEQKLAELAKYSLEVAKQVICGLVCLFSSSLYSSFPGW